MFKRKPVRTPIDPNTLSVAEIPEYVRQETLHAYEPLIKSFELVNLPSLAELIEERARRRLIETILQLSPVLCGGRRAVAKDCLLDRRNTLIRLFCTDQVGDNQRLIIVFAPVVGPVELKKKQIKISGTGRYKKIQFCWPSDLPLQVDLISAVTKVLVETAYAWFRTQVNNLVAQERVGLTRSLYQKVHLLVPNSALRRNLWFASVTEDRGFRLLDPNVTNCAFDLVENQSCVHGYSANRLVAEILATSLPRDKLLMQRAVAERRCIDADLSKAVYRQEGSIYAAALMALYGSESFTVFPLLMDEPISIVALFPTPHKGEIEPILAANQEALAKECKTSLSVVRRALRALRPSSYEQISYGPIAEVVVGALKGWFGNG